MNGSTRMNGSMKQCGSMDVSGSTENKSKMRAQRKRRLLQVASLCIMVVVAAALMGSGESCGATKKVKLHRHGSCSDCSSKRGDGKNGWTRISYDNGMDETTYRWVSYTDPLTGRTKKTDAYCLQPPKSSPGVGTRTAVLLNTASAGRQRNLSAILYFADGGPGMQALQQYLQEHSGTYPEFQTGKGTYALKHMMLAYAYDPDQAFRISRGDAAGKAHTKAFRKKIKTIYQWCLDNAVFVTDPGFAITPAEGSAAFDPELEQYVSEEFTVNGADSRQCFDYTVPEKAVLTLLHEGEEEEYATGSVVRICVGDTFWFAFDADRSGGIVKTEVAGELCQLLPYQIKASGKQDLGFYAAENRAAASFAVALEEPSEPEEPQPQEPSEPEEPKELQTQEPSATGTLQVTKNVKAGTTGAGRQFSFNAAFSGLQREEYFAVLPGQAAAQIASDTDGNISVTVSGSTFFLARGGDLTGLPVKIIRSDGEMQTLYTDAAGTIAAAAYIDWLRAVPQDRHYTIEFLKERYTQQW